MSVCQEACSPELWQENQGWSARVFPSLHPLHLLSSRQWHHQGRHSHQDTLLDLVKHQLCPVLSSHQQWDQWHRQAFRRREWPLQPSLSTIQGGMECNRRLACFKEECNRRRLALGLGTEHQALCLAQLQVHGVRSTEDLRHQLDHTARGIRSSLPLTWARQATRQATHQVIQRATRLKAFP